MAEHLNQPVRDDRDSRSFVQGMRNKFYAITAYPEDVVKLLMYVISLNDLSNMKQRQVERLWEAEQAAYPPKCSQPGATSSPWQARPVMQDVL